MGLGGVQGPQSGGGSYFDPSSKVQDQITALISKLKGTSDIEELDGHVNQLVDTLRKRNPDEADKLQQSWQEMIDKMRNHQHVIVGVELTQVLTDIKKTI